MKVTKGALVVMKGQNFDNLYELLSNTITGGVSVAAIGESTKDTKLWHMRLVHMSIQGMQEL